MENLLDILFDIVFDATKDTLYLIPFLLVVYLLMEWLEHKAGDAPREAVRRAGSAGPLIGAVLGAFPQCGFSAMGATLYAGRVITLGTLFAVFLSTSDELLPMMIAEHAPVGQILAILIAKVVVGMVMGFAIDAVLRARRRLHEPLAIHKICAQDKCECSGECVTCRNNPELTYEHDRVLAACECTREHAHEHGHGQGDRRLHDCGPDCDHGCECEHEHEHQHTGTHILRSAVKHTLKVTLFIWVVSLVLCGLFAFVGEDAMSQALSSNPVASVFASALVGLIPNCAASVAIIELYLEGMLGTGAMMSGLLVASGVGLLVLCRTNRDAKQNLLIIAALYVIGVAWGLLFMGLGISF